jgi:hypothetical protein
VGALKGGPGPGVEDPAAAGTAIIEDGLTVVAMKGKSLGGLAARAAEPGRMKTIEEELITCNFIH